MRKLKAVTSVLAILGGANSLLKQFLFWNTTEYHTLQISQEIANSSLLFLAGAIMLMTIHNYQEIKKEMQ